MRRSYLTAILIPSAALGATWNNLREVAYAPAASAQDEQTWTVEHTLELADITLEVAGEGDGNIPEIEMSTQRHRSLTIAQVHVESADGRPIVLERTFSAVEETLEGAFVIEGELDETLEATIDAPLEELAVRFRWNAEDAVWERKSIDADGEETEGDDALPDQLLAGLRVDAHLGGLLDGLEDVKKGTLWEADPGVLVALVAPGGDLGEEIDCTSGEERGFESVAAGLNPLLGMDLFYILAGETDGEVEGAIQCELKELDGERAVIAVRVEVTATRDILDRVSPWVDIVAEQMPVDVAMAEATVEFSGEGTVVWDVAAGLPKKVSLELSIGYSLEREADIETPDGQELTIITTIELEGNLTSTMTTD